MPGLTGEAQAAEVVRVELRQVLKILHGTRRQGEACLALRSTGRAEQAALARGVGALGQLLAALHASVQHRRQAAQVQVGELKGPAQDLRVGVAARQRPQVALQQREQPGHYLARLGGAQDQLAGAGGVGVARHVAAQVVERFDDPALRQVVNAAPLGEEQLRECEGLDRSGKAAARLADATGDGLDEAALVGVEAHHALAAAEGAGDQGYARGAVGGRRISPSADIRPPTSDYGLTPLTALVIGVKSELKAQLSRDGFRRAPRSPAQPQRASRPR